MIHLLNLLAAIALLVAWAMGPVLELPPDATLAVADHNVPTTDRRHGISDPESALSVATRASDSFGVGTETDLT